jgi:hypothetical protein
MMRLLGLFLLFVSFTAGAFAQSQTPASAKAAVAAAGKIVPGNYAGRVQEQGGTRAAEIKMTIRDITTDGRVTGTVESQHTRPACNKRLPVNGMVLPEGDMRLTVDDGAPEGCERLYVVKVASGGTLTGTFLDGKGAASKGMKK